MTEPAGPTLRVVRGGTPSDDELAALVAAITMRAAATPTEDPARRRPLSPWVASGLVNGTRTKA